MERILISRKEAAIDTDRAGRIIDLHNEVIASAVTTVKKAIEAGQLLTEQKAELPHGQFTQWIESNLPFTPRTARNYMSCYDRRELLKTETVSVLSDAYKLLKADTLNDKSPQVKQVDSIAVETFEYFDEGEMDAPYKSRAEFWDGFKDLLHKDSRTVTDTDLQEAVDDVFDDPIHCDLRSMVALTLYASASGFQEDAEKARQMIIGAALKILAPLQVQIKAKKLTKKHAKQILGIKEF